MWGQLVGVDDGVIDVSAVEGGDALLGFHLDELEPDVGAARSAWASRTSAAVVSVNVRPLHWVSWVPTSRSSAARPQAVELVGGSVAIGGVVSANAARRRIPVADEALTRLAA